MDQSNNAGQPRPLDEVDEVNVDLDDIADGGLGAGDEGEDEVEEAGEGRSNLSNDSEHYIGLGARTNGNLEDDRNASNDLDDEIRTSLDADTSQRNVDIGMEVDDSLDLGNSEVHNGLDLEDSWFDDADVNLAVNLLGFDIGLQLNADSFDLKENVVQDIRYILALALSTSNERGGTRSSRGEAGESGSSEEGSREERHS